MPKSHGLLESGRQSWQPLSLSLKFLLALQEEEQGMSELALSG